jgi:addiction module RelB/DinJ family antitoxin
MESGLVRFMVDPEIRARAEQVCAHLGLDLNEVLRAFLVRVARDGKLPFAPEPASQPDRRDRPAPFSTYDPRAWAPLAPVLNAELAVEVLDHVVASSMAQIQAARAAGISSDEKQAAERLAGASTARLALEPSDNNAIASLLNTFAAQLAPPTEPSA